MRLFRPRPKRRGAPFHRGGTHRPDNNRAGECPLKLYDFHRGLRGRTIASSRSSGTNRNQAIASPVAHQMQPSLKRRRVRRGTQSCWECKRRKVRCTFVTPTESICDGCRSRRVPCIGQEFLEDKPEAAGTRRDGTIPSLGQMKAVVRRLDKSVGPSPPKSDAHDRSSDNSPGTLLVSLLVPSIRNVAISTNVTSTDCPVTGPEHVSRPDAQVRGIHDGLCRTLRAVWPTEEEMDLVWSVPVSTSVLFHGLVCAPYSRLLRGDMPSLREVLRLPPPGAHPVLIARKLLLLAIFLQGIPRRSVRDLGTFTSSYAKTMHCLAETARLVTTDDDLLGSLEGIECVMMEGMYLNNAGKLRKAWVTHRRAMVVAQMLGLHLAPSPSRRVPALDVETQLRVDAAHMWHRLVITDRYLSLMLGLPQCSIESPFASSEALAGCTPVERMERMESTACGFILQRNKKNVHHLEKTEEIDKLLQEAASLMEPQWWLAPNISVLTDNNKEALGETLRLMNQFTHYHLLAQLHLPYLLHPSSDRREYDYSKTTAITASREILLRFVSFRGSESISAYCRGIDFLAFIASTVLSLAHIDSYRQQAPGAGTGGSGSALRFLAHQRLTDRGLLEKTLQCMEDMAHGHGETDALAQTISHLLRKLLTIEAAAAKGTSYSTSVAVAPTEPGEPGEADSAGEGVTTNADASLHIHIPYFGTVKIELRGADSADHALLEVTQCSSVQGGNHNDLEPPSGYQLGNQSLDPERPNVSVPFDLPLSNPSPDESFSDFGYGFDAASLLVPGLSAEVDEWALQGVEMALFENLVRETAEPGL